MAELERRRIACVLDDTSDEELLGGTSSTDENVDLESSNSERSGESTDDEIHSDIQRTLSVDATVVTNPTMKLWSVFTEKMGRNGIVASQIRERKKSELRRDNRSATNLAKTEIATIHGAQ